MSSPPGFDDLPPPLRARAAEIVAAALQRALARAPGFEFAGFRIGTRPLPEFARGAAPHAVAAEMHDFVRAVVRIELRRRLEAAWPARHFDPHDPDMIVDVRPREHGAGAWLEPQQAFVAGRYRKLSREMSQTVFHCRRCRGRGARHGRACRDCGGSGRSVPEAVADFVRPAIRDALGGRDATFHGAGREDVDVRMLGDGRPFVVTVESPVRRQLAAADVAARVVEASGGRVEARGLRVVDRKERRRITTEHGEKIYRVVVAPREGAVLPPDAAARVAALGGVTLAQRNPIRARRRADVVRERTVRALSVEDPVGDPVEDAAARTVEGTQRLVLRVTTDPGLYVKELVSGDEGRTTPSVAGVLGVPCFCAELDVIGVRASSAAAPGRVAAPRERTQTSR